MNRQLHKLGFRTGLILSSFLLVAGLQLGSVSAAGSGYAASDVIGQLNGTGDPDFTTSNFGISESELDYPTGSAVDTVHHRLFVGVDGTAYRVVVYNLDANNNLLDHFADYIIGQPDFATNGSATTQNGGSYLWVGVLYDSTTNRLYVNDTGNYRVLVYDLSGGITNGMNASYVLGQPDFTTATANTTQNGLGSPSGFGLDPVNQRLFVADYSNYRVLVYDLSGGITNGMNASYVLGQPDFTTATANTTQNGMSGPEDVAYNQTTKMLFVADSGNTRVLVYDLSGGITNGMNASYVLGQPDFTTGFGGSVITTQSSMGHYVTGLGVDPTRNVLYVADNSNSRVLVYNLSSGVANGMNASMVLGQPDFTTKTSATSQTGMSTPEAKIGIDTTQNRIYVTDSGNNRVLVYNFAHLTNPSGSTTAATANSPFTMQLHVAGAQGTVTYAVTGGSLPPGVSLNPSTGLISGTPTTTGTYTFEITTTDNLGSIGSYVEDPQYTINVLAASTSGLPGAPNTGYGKVANSFSPLVMIVVGSFGLIISFWYRYKPAK